MGKSVLDQLIRAGAYELRPGSTPSPSPAVTPAARTVTPAPRAVTPTTRTVTPAPRAVTPVEPPPLTPGTHAEVKVVSVTSVSSLHVRPLETEPLVQRMWERLTDSLNVSACSLQPDKVAEGIVCAAFKVRG